MARIVKPNGNDTRPKKFRLITNSQTLKVGDFITDASVGASKVSTNAMKVLGVVSGFVTKSGTYLDSVGGTTGLGGTFTASTKTYAAASNNQTVDAVKVEYEPIREGDQILADLSAAKGATTGSNLEGYYLAINTADASQLDETTASATITSTQFRIKDPNTAGLTTQVIVECIQRNTNI